MAESPWYDVDKDGNGSSHEPANCKCGSTGTQYYDYIDHESYDDGFLCDDEGCRICARKV